MQLTALAGKDGAFNDSIPAMAAFGGGLAWPPRCTMAVMRSRLSVLRRPHHGWAIAAILFLAAALNIGAGTYAFGLFVEPLEDAFGWSRSAVSASLSFAAIGSLTSPLLGRFMDRHGARPLFIASLLVMGTSFLLRPLMGELWHWYALSFLQFVFSPGVSPLPIGRLVAIWFPRNRGRVLGITIMGNNFGGATVPIITWLVIVNASWEAAYVVYAAIAGSIALLGLSLVRERGRAGGSAVVPGGAGPSEPSLTGWTVSEALRTPTFYAITVATTLAMFTYSGVLPWVSAHLANEGMSAELAARAMTVVALSGMTGKVLFGSLADRITARRAMMLSLAGQVVFVLLMVAYPTPPLVWLFIPLFGLAMGAFGVLVTLIAQEAFGVKFFGSISGLIHMPSVTSLVAGPLIAGASFDLSRSYGPGFLTVAAMFVIAIIALTWAKPAARPS